MSNYTKSTNFATKDNLTPGDPLKIVRGTEIDTEFNNIATAVATKTDNSAAAITGGSITGITDLAIADGGTGASTATAAINNLLPAQTSAANKYLQSDGTNVSWDAVTLSTADITGTLGVTNGGTGVTSSTGTGNVVLSNSPTLVTPALGTPASGVATNITGLPISTGVSGLGTGVATFLGTPSSANLASAVTDETGSGALVFATSPTLVTPALGTPSALVGTNITGTASGLTAGNVTTNANLTGAVTSVGNATSLGSFTSSQLATALTDETGSGANVFATSPTLVTPILGTPTSATLTNATGLPLTTGVTGTLPTANGGTNLTSFTSGGVVYASSTSALATGSALTFDGTNLSSTGGATFQGGPIGYGGGEIRLGSTSASLQNGISTQGTGTPQIIFDHRGTSNTGTFTWRNGTGGANTLLFLGATGNMQLNTTTNKTTAFSGNGSGLTIGAALAPTLALYDTTNTTYVFNLTQIEADTYLYNTANGAMAFGTNNAEGMRLTSTGLGIGTSSPAQKLDVAGNIGTTGTLINTASSGEISKSTGATTGNIYHRITNTGGSTLVGNESSAGGTLMVGSSAYSGLINVTGAYALGFGTNNTERMRLDSAGNLGLGVTPNWNTYTSVLQLPAGGIGSYVPNLDLSITQNAYYSSAWKYSGTGAANRLNMQSGAFNFFTAASGTAGNAISFTQAMTLDASGNLGVGTTSPGYPIQAFTSSTSNPNTISMVNNSTTNISSLAWVQAGSNNLAYTYITGDGRSTGYMSFSTNNAERARITSDGNLGVGTTSPACTIDSGGMIRSKGATISASGEGTEIIYTAGTPWIASTNQGLVQAYNRGASTYSPLSFSGSLLAFVTGGSERARIPAAGGFQSVGSISVGNATPTTSGAGITFPATQSASSDANTLDDYEEGTWTPNQGAGLTVVGTFSSSGTYTKIGRFVYVKGKVNGSTSVAVAAGSIITGNLPFSATDQGTGSAVNANFNVGSVAAINALDFWSMSAIGAGGSIVFSGSYAV